MCSIVYYTLRMAPSRPQILSELARIDALRRGSLTDQTFVRKKADGSTSLNGPYTLYTRKDGQGRSVSKRLSDPAQIAVYREHIAAHDQFEQLTNKLVELGEARSDELLAGAGDAKKNARRKPSRSNKKPR